MREVTLEAMGKLEVESDAIEGIYDPYLLQLGFLDRTPGDARPRAWPMNTWASLIRKASPLKPDSFLDI